MSADEQRAALRGLTSRARRELERMWGRLASLKTAEQWRDGLLDLVPPLGDSYGSAAGALAADWYDDLRDRAGVPGRFSAEAAALPPLARYEVLVRWGVGPLFRPEPEPAAALSLIDGGLQRIVADAHRDTVRLSSVRDPKALGWQRVGGGSTCEFCEMLISRGAVYSEASADFESHDRCNCAAAPLWE